MQIERWGEQALAEAVLPSASPLIEGLLYGEENVLFVADKKSGKSLFTMQLALCVAHGLPLLERFVVPKPRRVLYVSLENTTLELQGRIKRMRGGLGLTQYTPNLTYVRLPYLYVTIPDAAATLHALLSEFTPDLLVLDPLYHIHKGSVNDDGPAGETTSVLSAMTAAHGHATWINHHEHRARYDIHGLAFEDAGARYAGSWVWGAWCTAMYGLRFVRRKKSAEFIPIVERTERVTESIKLSLLDQPDRLAFRPALEDRLDVAVIDGMSVREIARHYEVNPASASRLLTELVKSGRVRLVPQGKGKETIVEAM